MKVFHSYGSKERLFEVFNKVNKVKINEDKIPFDDKKKFIEEFIKYVDNELGLNGDLPKISLSNDSDVARQMKSFGKYTPEDKTLLVVISNRNLADILRTTAHELIHHKQYLKGELTPYSSQTGSDIENEANSLAGIFMREFAINNPMIFE